MGGLGEEKMGRKFPGSLHPARPPGKLMAAVTREGGRCSSPTGSSSEVGRCITPSQRGAVFRAKKLRHSRK